MLKILSPWYTLYNEVKAMFAQDRDIRVIFDDETEVKRIKLYVADNNKAAALDKLMKHEYNFGNVVVYVDIIPANTAAAETIIDTDDFTTAELYEIAFADNPALVTVGVVHGILGFDMVYVIFKKEVVQYYNDDLSDAFGQRSTLYQEIAKELFAAEDGLFFCTNKNEGFGAPLGEWP